MSIHTNNPQILNVETNFPKFSLKPLIILKLEHNESEIYPYFTSKETFERFLLHNGTILIILSV